MSLIETRFFQFEFALRDAKQRCHSDHQTRLDTHHFISSLMTNVCNRKFSLFGMHTLPLIYAWPLCVWTPQSARYISTRRWSANGFSVLLFINTLPMHRDLDACTLLHAYCMPSVTKIQLTSGWSFKVVLLVSSKFLISSSKLPKL